MSDVWVIGSGPAGLMAAQEVAAAGHGVTVVDHKPSFGRKFLMAGKSGLNLTKSEAGGEFRASYTEGKDWLKPILQSFGPDEVVSWARSLGQDTFVGSSGRVFPKTMKASPLLRAWLGRLADHGVRMRPRWRWIGWKDDAAVFDAPEGQVHHSPDAMILALGGGSWSRLGSDLSWLEILEKDGVEIAPILPSNAALRIDWSQHMAPHFGVALKNVAFSAGPWSSRGEAILSRDGLEGGGIYAITPGIRADHALNIDLLPGLTLAQATAKLEAAKPKDSLSNRLRKTLALPKVKTALFREAVRQPAAEPAELAAQLKNLVLDSGLAPRDDAISTCGGITRNAVDEALMLRSRPGVFVAGEMLDWDAPTGGYLITACLATGRHAGLGAVDWLARA